MSAAPSTAASAAAESNPRNGLLRKQIFALTKKNYLLSRRSKLTVCCEILLPLFVAVVCFVVAPLVNSSSRDLVTYAEAEYPYTISEGARPGTLFYASRIRDTYERYTELSALTSYQNFVNNSNPITLLLTCACQTLAIGPAGTPAAEDFASYLRSSFDSVFKGLNLPQCGGGPSITISTSVSDPRDYVASSEYGSAAFPELCGYMSVENPYEVLVMGNATVGDNGRFKAVSFDYSEYNSFWYAENGDIQHGDPDDNGLIYYEALNMPALLGTYLDYRRGDSRPIAGVYPMPYESYQTRGAGSDLILLGNVLGPFLYTFSAFSVSRKLISERKGRLREGMRIMGLFDFPYNVSWYLWYVSFYLVFSFIVAVLSLVVLPIVSALWLFLLSLLYFFASMSFAFAISTLFENPNSGSTLTAVIYYVLAITVSVIERETSKWAISLLPQCAFTLIIQNLGQQLFLGKESPSATLAFQDFTLLQGLLMLIVDFVLWTVVYLYLDQVVPHEYRSSRKFYFLFTKGFWREMTGKDEVDEARGQGTEAVPSEVSSSTVDEGIERVRGEQQGKLERDGQVVRIHDLKVEFGQFRAVDGLDLTMYRDELFVLLGHNGAGKSTTINVLSGMIKPTSGAVTIFNREVPTEMPVIRRSMGICPQNDVLWDDLTVSEHFDIFASLRGLKRDAKALEFATEIELGHKFNSRVKTLSGGMKRKLSVGLAFVGDSKLVILDEPSSGMDPSARRRMWDFLRSKREGRILCITTHYMDEADVLADRVGIMENGKLMAYGTTNFLKHQFGSGYTLSIAKRDSTVPDEPLVDVIRNNVDDPSAVRVRSSAGQELALQLPYDCVSKFPRIFDCLDERKASNEITAYGIAVTSMEDVFLNVAHRVTGGAEPDLGARAAIESMDEAATYDIDLKPTFSQQLHGLMKRRLIYAIRNWVGTLTTLLIPMIVLLVLMGFQTAAVNISDAVPITLNALSNPYSAGPSSHIIGQWNMASPLSVRVTKGGRVLPSIDASAPLTQTEAAACGDWDPVTMLPFRSDVRPNATISNAFCAAILRFSASLLDEKTAWFDVTALDITSRVLFADMTALHTVPLALLGDQSLSVVNHPFPHTAYQKSSSLVNFAISFAVGGYYAIALAVVASTLLSYIMMEKTTRIKEQLYVSGCGILPYWIACWLFDFFIILVAVCLTFVPLQVYNIQTYLENPRQQATWALLIGFCFAVPPFNYLISLFARTNTIANYVRIGSSILGGLIGSFAVSILYYAVVSPVAGLVLMWILRVFPTYSVAQGLTSIFFTNIGFFSTPAGEDVTPAPFDSQILSTCTTVRLYGLNEEIYDTCLAVAGDDVIMLFVYGVVYFGLTLFIDLKLCSSKWNTNRDLPVPPEKRGVEDERVIEEKERVSKLDASTQMIYFKDLKKVYYEGKKNEVWAVRGINYALADGGVFGLLGVNGAGKTTTFRMLCGLVNPSAGNISLIGRPLAGNVYEIRKSVGYCPQDNPLLQGLTTKDHLYLYARIRGVPPNEIPQHVDDLVRILRLERYVDKEAVKLSGGNQRKLCVGMALVGHPPVVFLDEPTTGVDPEARRRIWDVIHKIAHDRCKTSAVILTTHSMEEADALCETMVIQVDGQFRCIGTSQQIKSDYGRGYHLWMHFRSPSTLETNRITAELLGSDKASTIGGYAMFADGELVARLSRLGITNSRLVDSVLSAGTLDDNSVRTFNQGALTSAVSCALQHLKALQWLKLNISEHAQSLEEIGEFALPRDVDLGDIFGKLTSDQAKEELEMEDFQLSQTTLEQIFNMFAHGGEQSSQ